MFQVTLSGTNVRQKTDSGSILSPLFFNKFSSPKSTKKDVPDYQAHPKIYSLIHQTSSISHHTSDLTVSVWVHKTRNTVNNVRKVVNLFSNLTVNRIRKRAENVEATIHSRYYELFLTDLKKHNEQYREIKFIQLPQKNHDRFLIIDNNVYLLGASVKDMGVGMCAVTKMQVSAETILQLLK